MRSIFSRSSSSCFAANSSSCLGAGLPAFDCVGVAPRVEATLAEVFDLTTPVRPATTAEPIPAADGRGLAPTVDTRVGPDGVGETTELRVDGTVGLEPETTRVVVLAGAAPATDGRAEVAAAVGLVAVDDNEGLLLCPGVGATDVRRARGSDGTPGLFTAPALALAPAPTAGLEAAGVEVESGDFFTAVPGAGCAGFAIEVFRRVDAALGSGFPTCILVLRVRASTDTAALGFGGGDATGATCDEAFVTSLE